MDADVQFEISELLVDSLELEDDDISYNLDSSDVDTNASDTHVEDDGWTSPDSSDSVSDLRDATASEVDDFDSFAPELIDDSSDSGEAPDNGCTDSVPEPEEAPAGRLEYSKLVNDGVRDDLIRISWHPSGDFAFVLGLKGDVALYRPGQNLVKVGKVGSSPADMVVVPTETGVDLVVLDTTLGLLRTRLTEAGDALEPHVATTFPQGSTRAITPAPAASVHAGKYAITTYGTDYITYIYLWHPDTGLSPVKGFNAGAGVIDLMWGEPTIYANEPWILTTHGRNGADSKSWILSTNEVVSNTWSPGFGNAGFAAWRPDPTRPSGLGTYGMVSGWSSNKLYVYDGAWRMAELPVPTGAAPQGIAWKWDGKRALIVGRVIGNPAYATVIEHRPTNAAWSASFVNQSISGFTSAPWSGNSSSQYLIDVAWRPNTACDEGLIVGADSGSSFSPTFGFAIHFVDLDDPACR